MLAVIVGVKAMFGQSVDMESLRAAMRDVVKSGGCPIERTRVEIRGTETDGYVVEASAWCDDKPTPEPPQPKGRP